MTPAEKHAAIEVNAVATTGPRLTEDFSRTSSSHHLRPARVWSAGSLGPAINETKTTKGGERKWKQNL